MNGFAVLRKIRKGEKGFTLVEFMFVSILTSIFLLACALVMIVGYRNWHINRAAITLHDDLVKGIRSMVRELREAGAASPNGIQTLAPGNSGLSFELPSAVDPSGPTAWQTIVFTLGGSDGKKILRNDGTNTTVLANNVSDLDFTYNALTNPREIGIAISGTRQAANGTVLTQSLSMEVTVRN